MAHSKVECHQNETPWYVGAGLQTFKSNGATSVEKYCCPLKVRCKCPCQIRVTKGTLFVKSECSGGEHTQARCHAVDTSKFLSTHQRMTIAKMIKSNPAMTGTEVRRATSRGSPTGKIKPALLRSIRSAVKVSRRQTLAGMTGGIAVTDVYSSIAALGDRLWFGDILRKHNSGEHHFSNVHFASATSVRKRQVRRFFLI